MKLNYEKLIVIIGIAVILIAMVVSAFGISPSREIIPSLTPFPTYTLNHGEAEVQVSHKLVSTYNDLRIGGGSAMVRDYVDSSGQSVNGLAMVISFMDEAYVAYKGLEFDYKSYHIRVLDVYDAGATILAISKK